MKIEHHVFSYITKSYEWKPVTFCYYIQKRLELEYSSNRTETGFLKTQINDLISYNSKLTSLLIEKNILNITDIEKMFTSFKKENEWRISE